MHAKIALVIVSMAACGLALVAMRQLRAQTAHELAAARLRIVEADAQLLRVRAEIASRVSPSSIAEMAIDLGPIKPVVPGPSLVEGEEDVQVREASHEARP